MSPDDTRTIPRPRRHKGTTGIFAKPVQEVLAKVSKTAIAKKGFVHARLISHWPEIVGIELARYCQPRSVTFPAGKRNHGVLTVSVDSGRAPEIQHQSAWLLEKMAVYFGYRAIDRITILQESVSFSATASPAPAEKPERVTTYSHNATPLAPVPLPFPADSPLGSALHRLQQAIDLD